MTRRRHLILATAGHVDHGKSALVRALTGHDPDRLPEEKARGMTIDLGFSRLVLGDLDVGLIDVPGHEDFVKNMVAGVGAIDAALLVVAADDRWMPQTEEHLQILQYLGVTRGVVAVTKIDLVSERDHPALVEDLRQKFDPPGKLPGWSFVATSTKTGEGIDTLRAALADCLSTAPPPADVGRPRLSVDRAFTLRGIGTVVTGTLTGGRLAVGSAVEIFPGQKASKIRSLQSHGASVESAGPGTRVAANLTDVAVTEIGRGQMLCLPGDFTDSTTVDVLLTRSDRAGPPPGRLRDGMHARIHSGTSAIAGRLLFLDPPDLSNPAIVQVRLEQPMVCVAGDRLVVRDPGEAFTLAGGVVLESNANRRQFRSDNRRAFFARRIIAPAEVENRIVATLIRDGSMAIQRWDELVVDRLIAAGQVVRSGDRLVDPAQWTRWQAEAAAAVDDWHAKHSEQIGLPVTSLRELLARHGAGGIEASLLADGFVRFKQYIRRTTHQPRLPPRLAAAGDRIRKILVEHPFDPPSRGELAPDATAEQALKFLIVNGEVVQLATTVLVGTAALDRACEIVHRHLAVATSATVADLKAVLNSSRRIMVPLLEELDRRGVTVRSGDLRRAGTGFKSGEAAD